MNMKEKKLLYFDMHSHILPGIDDGAGSLGEALKMADMAYKEGIRYICATPHFAHDHHDDFETYRNAYEKLKKALKKNHPDMQIFPANELFYSYGISDDLKHRRALTYNGSRYALTEFDPQESYDQIFDAVRELAQSGYVPVIAHVERVRCLWKQWESMDQLRDMNVLFQMNTTSLIGGRLNLFVRQCRKLVKEGYIDLLGTDMHNCRERAPIYAEAADWIRLSCGRQVYENITGIYPRKILTNERI